MIYHMMMMGSKLKNTNFFCLAFALGSLALTAAVSIQEIPQNPIISGGSQMSKEEENENDEKALKRQLLPPSLLLPTEILNPSQSNVHPAHLLPLDMMPLGVTPLDSKLEEMSEESKINSDEIARLIESTLMEYFNHSSSSQVGPQSAQSSGKITSGHYDDKNSTKHLWSKFDMQEETEVDENEQVQQANDADDNGTVMEEEEDSVENITLELNPNSSDLEFVHTNSTHRPVSPVPNFMAQILTLSYGGVKKPVLIVQPEMSKIVLNSQSHHPHPHHKHSDIEGGGSPSSQHHDENLPQQTVPMEETSIPSFSIHFPLDTNSQFQIPRYNFTLPTLFLPGLVFTQNENVKTNTHEVHVSFPHQSNDMTRPVPPPLVQAEFELLPFQKEQEKGGKVESEEIKQNEKIPVTTVEKNVSANENNKDKPRPRPGVLTPPPPPPPPPPPAKENVSKPLNVTTTLNTTLTNSAKKDKWRFPNLGQLYSKFIGGLSGRREVEGEEEEGGHQNSSSGSSFSSSTHDEEDLEKGSIKLCGSKDELCGATCHRLGFHLGKCVDELSCVCLLKQRPDLGVKLDYYEDKRDRSWQEIYPVRGLCHVSSCRINCGRAGYVTGFCDNSICLCGLPWSVEESTV